MAVLGIADTRPRRAGTPQDSDGFPYVGWPLPQRTIKLKRPLGYYTPTIFPFKPLASSEAHVCKHGWITKPSANRFRQRLLGARGDEEPCLPFFHHLGQPSNRGGDHRAPIVISHWNNRAGGNFNVGKNDCIRCAKQVLSLR